MDTWNVSIYVGPHTPEATCCRFTCSVQWVHGDRPNTTQYTTANIFVMRIYFRAPHSNRRWMADTSFSFKWSTLALQMGMNCRNRLCSLCCSSKNRMETTRSFCVHCKTNIYSSKRICTRNRFLTCSFKNISRLNDAWWNMVDWLCRVSFRWVHCIGYSDVLPVSKLVGRRASADGCARILAGWKAKSSR